MPATTLDDLLPHLIDSHAVDPVRLAATGTIADAAALGRLHDAYHRDGDPGHTHTRRAPQQHLTDAEIESDREAVYGPAREGRCASCRDRVRVRPDDRCDVCIGLPIRGGDGSMAACPSCDWWYIPGTEADCGDCGDPLPDLPYPWVRTTPVEATALAFSIAADLADDDTYQALSAATAARIAHLEQAWAAEYADLVEAITGMRPVRIDVEIKNDDDLAMHRLWDAAGNEYSYHDSVGGHVLGEISEFDTVSGDEWSRLASEGDYLLDVPPKAYRYVLEPDVTAIWTAANAHDDHDWEVRTALSGLPETVEVNGVAVHLNLDALEHEAIPNGDGEPDDYRASLAATVVGSVDAPNAGAALAEARQMVARDLGTRFGFGRVTLLFNVGESSGDRIVLSDDDLPVWNVSLTPVVHLMATAATEEAAWDAIRSTPGWTHDADGASISVDFDTDDETVDVESGRTVIGSGVPAAVTVHRVPAADPDEAIDRAYAPTRLVGDHRVPCVIPGAEITIYVEFDGTDFASAVPDLTPADDTPAPTTQAACLHCGLQTEVYSLPDFPEDRAVRRHVDHDGQACGSAAGELQDWAVATAIGDLTVTQRRIAFEHVAAVTGVPHVVAANTVDAWDFEGLPADAELVRHTVRCALLGVTTVRSVGAVLAGFGVAVDTTDQTLLFGRLDEAGRPADWFNWAPGADVVQTLSDGVLVQTPGVADSTGRRVDAKVPDANPRRAAKALRRIVGSI